MDEEAKEVIRDAIQYSKLLKGNQKEKEVVTVLVRTNKHDRLA